jgi:hypothetical protein
MSATPYDAQLREIVGAVTIVSPEQAQVETRGGATQTVPIANERGAFLGLAEALYGGRYSAPSTPVAVETGDPDRFLLALRTANTLRQRYDRGVPQPRETLTAQYGHYVLVGPAIPDASTGRQVRFYWNLGIDGAARFVAEIARRFDRARIPFQAKVPVHPLGYARTDTGVLYLCDEDVDASIDAILGTYDALGAALRAEVPMFTQPLAAGLSFAESPANGDSFGMHRCDLIAEALVQAHRRELTDAGERLAVVRERLTKYGLDLERLAFNPMSRYPYRLAAFGEAA